MKYFLKLIKLPFHTHITDCQNFYNLEHEMGRVGNTGKTTIPRSSFFSRDFKILFSACLK